MRIRKTLLATTILACFGLLQRSPAYAETDNLVDCLARADAFRVVRCTGDHQAAVQAAYAMSGGTIWFSATECEAEEEAKKDRKDFVQARESSCREQFRFRPTVVDPVEVVK